jgi:cell division initiation protein
MLTARDVHNVTFAKSMRGYQVEQVDAFLDQAATQLEQDSRQIADLTASNEELKNKLRELAKVLEGYRNDEEALKSALLNAQRMGENVIREARQKADDVVRQANIRADDITRAAQSRTAEQEVELERIKAEVAQFKSNVLSLYKAHIESLSTLPDQENAGQEAAAQPAAEAPAPDVQAPEAELPQPAVPEAAAAPGEDQPFDADSAPQPAPDEDFWQKDEHALDGAPEEPPAAAAAGFRGITFSD